MNKSGTSVWINTPIEVLFDRLTQGKEERPLLKGLQDDQLRGFIIKKFSDRKIYYEQASVIVEDENKSIEKIVEKIFHA